MLRLQRFFTALLWVVLCHGAATAAPVVRDVWHAFTEDGLRYGHEHVRVERQEEGTFRYTTESRTLIDLLGAQPQEMTGRGEYLVSPSLAPVSLSIEATQLSGSVRVTGRVEGRTLTLTTQRAGAEHTSSFTFEESTPAIFSASLNDWLATLPGSTTEASVQLLDEDGIQNATARRLEPSGRGSRWEVSFSGIRGRGTFDFDADGILREMNNVAPRAHLERCTAEEAKDLEYRTLEGRYLLTFPVDRDIGALHRLESLSVTLTWRDIALDQFELEDARQRLVASSEKDGQYSATVKIAPLDAAPDAAPFPVSGNEFKPYLADTRYVKPSHDRIRETARGIVKGSKTSLEAVKALSEWVSTNIAVEMIAETLSGPEVLACKKGKCTEYATLFASLARSVGIPTRIALGDRLVSGLWAGHMWNEVFVGRWIPVDAGANEVGDSFALLKFIHSDTLEGTQPLRWKLVDSLNVTIADFKSRPSALTAKYTTGIDGRVYTNTGYACRLTAPVETWTIEDKSKPGVCMMRFVVPGADKVLIHFVAFALPGGAQPSVIVSPRLNMFQTTYEKFEVLRNEPMKIHGAKGHTLRFRRAARGDESGTMLTTEYVWVGESAGYLLNIIAEESAHEKYGADFERLLESFELLSEK